MYIQAQGVNFTPKPGGPAELGDRQDAAKQCQRKCDVYFLVSTLLPASCQILKVCRHDHIFLFLVAL